ncbi:MAG TPA: GntR family transcriptional regulator [Limnochorda sp.]
MIQRDSPIPLYYQIASLLKARIESGEWPPGHRVPSEYELMAQFGVSRHTIRQAMAELEREGLVYRQAGRGTYVRATKSRYPLTYLRGFTEQMEERGAVPSSKVLELAKETPEPTVRERLDLPAGEEVWRLRRLRLADGEPMALETMYIPVSVMPDLDRYDLESSSIYRLMERERGLVISGADQTIEAETAAEAIARLLGIPADSAVLRMKNVTYLSDGRAGCYVDCYFRADRYIFYVSMPRNPSHHAHHQPHGREPGPASPPRPR